VWLFWLTVWYASFPLLVPLFLTVRNKDRLRPRYEVRIVPLFQNGFLPLALYRAKGYRVTWRYCLLCLA
jgi:hypothetical protein